MIAKQNIKQLWMFIALLCASVTVSAYDFEEDGIRYNVISHVDFTVETTSSPNAKISQEGVLNLPDSVRYNGRTLSVVKIGKNSFQDSSVKTVNIGKSVKEISDNAFSDCQNLNSVCADSIKVIGHSAFANCPSLSDVTVGPKLNAIGDYAFAGCSSLKGIKTPANLYRLGDYCFAESGLVSFQFTRSINIGSYAFNKCNDLTNIDCQGVTLNLAEGAFCECRNLSELRGFVSPSELPNKVFNNCVNLEINDILTSDSLKVIGDYSFGNCKFPSEIVIKPTIKKIGKEAFSGFVGNVSILDSEDVLNVDYSFSNMEISSFRLGRNLSSWRHESFSSALIEFIIGPLVTAIAPPVRADLVWPHNDYKGYAYGGSPFVNCVNLKTVLIESSNTVLTISGGGRLLKREEHYNEYNGDMNYYDYYSGLFSECPIKCLKILRPIETNLFPNYYYEYGKRYIYTNTRAEKPFKGLETIQNLSIDYNNLYLEIPTHKLTTLYLGRNVTKVPDLSSCALSEISIRNGVPPTAIAFNSSTYIKGRLIIPTGTKDIYRDAQIWCNFWQIDEDESLFDKITAISLPDAKDTLILGEAMFLHPVIEPKYATNPKLSYSSSDSNVVSCNDAGINYACILEAVGVGSATITISACDGSGVTLEHNVHVVQEVGFKNVYNTVTYMDMDISNYDNYFNYIPEITGPFSEDDFWTELLFLDKDNVYPDSQHVLTIAGGEYAGNYVNTNIDRPMYAGKYIFKLTPKRENLNVVANPSQAYMTVNRTSNNLEWDADSPISVKVGEKIDFGIAYRADQWCNFVTDYDNELIDLSSYDENGMTPHWYATGLKEGETYMSFRITCDKNDMGFYNFSDSQTESKWIKVEPSSGIEGVETDNGNISVRTKNGTIFIYNKPENSIVRVFNLQGSLIKETEDSDVKNLAKGMYVITVEDRSFKVML